MQESGISLRNLKGKKLLLHSCCAPCSGSIMYELKAADINFTVFYYNPNIHPHSEYEKRKEEIMKYAEKLAIPCIDLDYKDKTEWFERIAGLEDEPERGKRCSVCFDIRMERTAKYASGNGFNWFATTLGLSRYKDLAQVNQSGLQAALKYPEVNFLNYNWRSGGGLDRSKEINQLNNFYRQQYCGCIFSLMDANDNRKKKGRPLIKVRP